MGRGRGRGRGKASVTASPVTSAVYPSGVACTETYYDGVNDFFYSSEAALKIGGQFTFATQVKFNSLTNFDSIYTCRDASTGFNIYIYSDGRVQYLATDSGVNSIATAPAGSITTGVYHDIVCTCDATTARIYIDGVLKNTGAASLTSGMGTIVKNPYLATAYDAASRVLHGYMKNITFGSGNTSTPTAWTPTDPSSLVGMTEIMYSTDGNGTNRNSLTFTQVGDPITADCA
jgi:hypothetical protein